MRTIAVAARKGGCGKTTLSTHLAVAATLIDKLRVRIIDLDPQGTASEWADSRGDDPPDVISAQVHRLSRILDTLREQGETDLVILDTPPTAGEISYKAVEVADVVLIPSRVQAADLSAVLRTYDTAAGLQNRAYVVFNDESPARRKTVVEETRRVLSTRQIEAAPVVLHSRVAFGESQDIGRTVLETDPQGAAADEVRQLYSWLKELVERKSDNQRIRKSG